MDIDAALVSNLRYYEAAYHINRLYARQHGYNFILHGAYESHVEPKRHEAWMKIQILRDSLECCCQWYALHLASHVSWAVWEQGEQQV